MSADSIRTRLQHWLAERGGRSSWRRRSRDAMAGVVESYLAFNAGDLTPTDSTQILHLADLAYPFGQRRYTPYKCWLTERKRLRFALLLLHESQLEAPNAEDYAACEVAIDMAESGDESGAAKLLDEQAPRRLNRTCPACGAPVGQGCGKKIVPCLSRVLPERNHGPLFGARP